jgi:hypothetical protein
VRPSFTITAVENAVSTSFCAVPAFMRVDPATTSGPVSTSTSTSMSSRPVACGLENTRPVCAPSSRAARSAPSTYGVRPDAVRPSTKSPAEADAASSAAPASSSSSAFSTACFSAWLPPAWCTTNHSAGALNVGTSSAASTVASRPDVPAPT